MNLGTETIVFREKKKTKIAVTTAGGQVTANL